MFEYPLARRFWIPGRPATRAGQAAKERRFEATGDGRSPAADALLAAAGPVELSRLAMAASFED
jgi:hypothetical protein